jgi:hypothetical protein
VKPSGSKSDGGTFAIGQRFNPYKLFTGIFIPEAIARYRGISLGAKLVYGRLCRYAGKDGDAYPSIGALGKEVGLSETQARAYVKELTNEKFIEREVRENAKGCRTSDRYFFLWHQAIQGSTGECRKRPPTGVRITEPPAPRITEPPEVRISASEENHHQQSQKKKPSGSANCIRGSDQSLLLPQADRSHQTQRSFRAQNDENAKTAARERLTDPRAEFRARLLDRHGAKLNPQETADLVSIDLGNRNLSLSDEFLDFDAQTTTNPAALTNPIGHYRKLVKRYANKHELRLLEMKIAMRARVKDDAPEKQCARCAGSPLGKGGLINQIGEYVACECAGPAVVALIAEMEANRQARAERVPAGSERAAAAKQMTA